MSFNCKRRSYSIRTSSVVAESRFKLFDAGGASIVTVIGAITIGGINFAMSANWCNEGLSMLWCPAGEVKLF